MTDLIAIQKIAGWCVWQEYLAHFGGLIWPTPKLLILR